MVSAEILTRCRDAYLRHHEDPHLPLISPIYGDLKGLPPLLLQVGEAEVFLEDVKRFADKARAADVDIRLEVWPDMPHAFQLFAPFLPDATQAIDHIGAFID